MLLTAWQGCGKVVPIEDGDEDADGQDVETEDGPCDEQCGEQCVDLQTDRLNCGSCGHVCPNADHGQGACEEGICGLDCDEGWWDVDGVWDNGCEYSCTYVSNDTCNGEDDDCDGTIDNFEEGSCPKGSEIPCETGCGSEGTALCSELCVAGECEPPDETCNGADDDCDTVEDNGFDCAAGMDTGCETSCGTLGIGTCNADCSKPQAAGCAPPEEACNWVDDNCTGGIDEGVFGAVVEDEPLTDGLHMTGSPVIAFGSANYVAAWEDNRDGHASELYTRALSLAGEDIGSDVRLVGNDSSERLGDMVWNGTHFGLAYFSDHLGDDQEIWVATANENAERMDSHGSIMQTNDQKYPSIIWDETNWALSWLDNRSLESMFRVYFAKINSADLNIIPSSEHDVSPQMSHDSYPALAWSGSRYAVVWNQEFASDWHVYISLLNADGTTDVDDRQVAESYVWTLHPSIVWTSSQWVVGWAGNDGSSEGYFLARVNPDGAKDGADVVVEDGVTLVEGPRSPFRVVLAPGLGIGAVWEKPIGAGRKDIMFQRFDFTLAPIAEPVIIASAGYSYYPHMAWDGSGFGLVWVNFITDESPIPSVHFARVGCLE